MIKAVLFDAANTLIFKPDLLNNIKTALKSNEINVTLEEIRVKHKLVSELINFPDRTDRIFYDHFNSELLYSLGCLPTGKLLDDVFNACTYLPWKAFDDCDEIKNITVKKAVLSNFNSGLEELLDKHLSIKFDNYIVSEKESCRKPDVEFYKLAVSKLQLDPNEILYIGDSLKLDIMPATRIGMHAFLIDRHNDYKSFGNSLNSFSEIHKIIIRLNGNG